MPASSATGVALAGLATVLHEALHAGKLTRGVASATIRLGEISDVQTFATGRRIHEHI